jgi:hypothetical protein
VKLPENGHHFLSSCDTFFPIAFLLSFELFHSTASFSTVVLCARCIPAINILFPHNRESLIQDGTSPIFQRGHCGHKPRSSSRRPLVHGPSHPQIIDKTFGVLLREQAKTRWSSPLGLSDHQDRTLTYAEADKRSDHLAQGLATVGDRKGDRVAIMMGNMMEYVELFYACAKLGALITLANYGYSEHEFHSVRKQRSGYGSRI